MKTPQILTLGTLALALVSCGSLKKIKKPLSGSGDFDPLSSPGSSKPKTRSAVVAPSSPSYKRGQWVETSMPNATFFRSIPKGNASADKVLGVATPLKVISSKGTYVKVELDSGDVGYVPEIMVIERKKTSSAAPSAPSAPPAPPVPEYGPVPPPVEPGVPGPGVAPPPSIPGSPPPVPSVPSLPSGPGLPAVPTVPTGSGPAIPSDIPTVPDIAPPPSIPGLTE